MMKRTSPKLAASLLWAAILGCAAPGSKDATTAGWSGEWDTLWRGGGARLILEQEGERVRGTYPLYDGRVEARAVGRELSGRWFDGQGREGEFVFLQARDGHTFTGRYDSGEWWTGVRAGAAPRVEIEIDQSTPAAALRTFLRANNETGPGKVDLLAAAAAVIHRQGAEAQGMNRIDAARLLFDVVDRLTFRLFDLPVEVTGNQGRVTLAQAGTGVTFTLRFRRIAGDWFLVAPPPERLRAKRAELIAARDPNGRDVSDPYELRSPRDTFRTLITGLDELGNVADNPAYRTLNMSRMSPVVRERRAPLLADYVKEVVDRAGYVVWQEIPDDPDSRQPYVHYQHAAGQVVVAPVEAEDGVIWQFTPETVRNIRAVYTTIGDMPLPAELAGLVVPHPYFTARRWVTANAPALLTPLGEIEAWQWLAMALIIVLGLGLGFAVSAAFSYLARRAGWHRLVGVRGRFMAWGIRCIVLGVVGALVARTGVLGIPANLAAILVAVIWILIVIGVVPLAWQLLSAVSESYRQRHGATGRNVTLVALTTGIARFAVIVAALLVLADALAIPWQGVLAGVGIGGLAVALAAQPTLQNFLAGLSLYADQPLAVGDVCRYDGKVGTIEHIGVRSTRIRSPDRTLVTIPNSDFSTMQLENVSLRDRMWLRAILRIRSETTPDQLRYLLAELRRLLIAHPKVLHDRRRRVRFAGFGDYSLDVEIDTYIHTQDYEEFVAVREDLFLRIMDIIKEAGTDFAIPGQIQYETRDAGLDEERIRAAEEKVAAWRREQRLPFPDIDERDRDTWDGTLDYPPEGSVAKREAEEPAEGGDRRAR